MKVFDASSVYDILDDINRVETKCNELVTRINNILHVTVTITTKTNWTRSDIPTVEQMERIRGNVEMLAQVISASYDIPTFDNHFNYENANSFEIAFDYIDRYIDHLIAVISQPIAGQYYANEPLLLAAERS